MINNTFTLNFEQKSDIQAAFTRTHEGRFGLSKTYVVHIPGTNVIVEMTLGILGRLVEKLYRCLNLNYFGNAQAIRTQDQLDTLFNKYHLNIGSQAPKKEIAKKELTDDQFKAFAENYSFIKNIPNAKTAFSEVSLAILQKAVPVDDKGTRRVRTSNLSQCPHRIVLNHPDAAFEYMRQAGYIVAGTAQSTDEDGKTWTFTPEKGIIA